jgi:nitrite reductase/ring-hydroxylating ferredoxin subunit
MDRISDNFWKGCIAGGMGAVALWRLHAYVNPAEDDWPHVRKSPDKNIFYPDKAPAASQRRHGYKHFPAPYPNGWMFVCKSTAVRVGEVIPLKMWGRDLVAFRGKDGKVGVLTAWCTHMGTHLGYGGFVEGNAVVCPYHEWKFDKDGALVDIPYIEDGGPRDCARKMNHMRKYLVIEKYGMIFAWMHADEAEPTDPWILAPPENLGLRFTCRAVMGTFHMHVMEPVHNSCDWYHFLTVHSNIGFHWRSWFKPIQVENWSPQARCNAFNSLDDEGKPLPPDHMITDQYTKKLKIFGITVPQRIAEKIMITQVNFHGCMLGSITMSFPICPFLGKVYTFVCMSPIAPFQTNMELWTFTEWGRGSPLGWLMTLLFRRTMNQDREVWEHRTQLPTRNWVKNDYQWKKFDDWLKQLYSPSSLTWTSELDW